MGHAAILVEVPVNVSATDGFGAVGICVGVESPHETQTTASTSTAVKSVKDRMSVVTNRILRKSNRPRI